MENRNLEQETIGKNDFGLCKQADELLRQTGCTIFGRRKGEVTYEQREFERRMQTGAYGNGGEKRRD